MPEVLGVDEQGREVARWIPGEAGGHPIRSDVASDRALVAAAKMIRRLHDMSVTFRWKAGGWQRLLQDPSGSQQVICHNDLSTHNLIYRGAKPFAVIDWEFASPGSRLWDLAYACWWLVPLHRPEFCQQVGWGEVDQPRRLRLFCDAYGLGSERAKLLAVIRKRQIRNQRQLRSWVEQGIIDPYDADDPTQEVGHTEYIDSLREDLAQALTG